VAILGKDLLNIELDFFKFSALFASDSLEIDERSYKYAELTTAFLNYDAAAFIALAEPLAAAYRAHNPTQYCKLAQSANSLIADMPLFRDRTDAKLRLLEPDYYNPFLQSEPSYPFRYAAKYAELASDLSAIRDRYSWFLKEIYTAKSGALAQSIVAANLEAFVSGVSLGLDPERDPANSGIQYEVRASASTGVPQLFEKLEFSRLLDFVYVDFFKGIMLGNYPKQCKLCGRYFVQERGVSYEYCSETAPNEASKTCREVGAMSSFRLKVRNNGIWKAHQRAYKKYYARVAKGKLTKSEFNDWALAAERLRNDALEIYERGGEFAFSTYSDALNSIE
jgi:hypothetical protein